MKAAFKRATSVLLALLLVLLYVTPTYADIPGFPHAFYGTLTCGGSPAPAGTVVTAKVGGVIVGVITTTVAGQYGGAAQGADKLAVQSITSGNISFYISNAYGEVLANETYPFHSEWTTELNLTSAALPAAPVVVPPVVPPVEVPPVVVPPVVVPPVVVPPVVVPPVVVPPVVVPPVVVPPVVVPPVVVPPTAKEVEVMAPDKAAEAMEKVTTPEAAEIMEKVATPNAAEIMEQVTTPKAAEIMEKVNTPKAAEILEKVVVEKAAAVMEKVTTEKLTEIIPAMSQTSLTERLPELSADKLYSVEPAVLFKSVPNAPTEQLVSELPPQPPPELKAPDVVYTTPTGAKYLAPETIAGEWVKAVGSPMPVDKLLIKTRRALKDVGTTIDVMEKLPPEVKVGLSAEQIVSSYLSITFENATPEDIELGHITFKVEQEWLKQNSIHKWSVVLNRYDPQLGQWLSTPTKKVGADDQYVYYTAVTTRFSVFAISGAQVVPPLEFKAANLVITPVEAETGKAITISADITNLSSTPGTYGATLWIDSTVETGQDVSLKAGETKAVSFTVTRNVEGSYKVRFDRLFGSFTATKPVPPPPFPWWWIVVGVVIVGLLVYFLVIRRR